MPESRSREGGIDNRKTARHNVVRTFFSAFLFADSLGDTHEVVVVNLSPEGIGIAEVPPLPVGEVVQLELHLREMALPPHLLGRSIPRLKAAVAWSDKANNAAGMRLVDVRPQQKQMLDGIVEYLKQR